MDNTYILCLSCPYGLFSLTRLIAVTLPYVMKTRGGQPLTIAMWRTSLCSAYIVAIVPTSHALDNPSLRYILRS